MRRSSSHAVIDGGVQAAERALWPLRAQGHDGHNTEEETMADAESKDVSAAVMRRIRWHHLASGMMGVAVFLFVMGMVMSRGGSRGGPGARIGAVGMWLFLLAIVYGLVSTFVNLRCPNCKRSFGWVVSSLYAPFGVSDDFSPKCRGCGATLLPTGERARAKRGFRNAFIGMFLLPFVAAAVGWLLGRAM